MSEHEHHKFRYLLPPGNNFAFVAKFRIWIIMSVLLMAASIGVLLFNKAHRGEYMNWTIDFKGGTELIVAFKDPAGSFTTVSPAKVREAFAKAKEEGVETSEINYTDAQPIPCAPEVAAANPKKKCTKDVAVAGHIIRSPRFSALKPEQEHKASEVFEQTFKARELGKAAWSGDRFYVRSKQPITHEEALPVFKQAGLDLKNWSEKDALLYLHADEGTGEYNEVFAMAGLDKQYEQLLEKEISGTDATIVQSYGVGAKAGDKLRDDAFKSIIYAIFLIMLYLAFRFDIRYAPGAAFATIHDAIMVIGVFALTWTEVSLTTVAGLLTVMGYSVNDTVIVFDRIRENQAKLKDKKIERIIDISINEMLVRTILTSATVFATTLIMNIFGTGLVRNFAFAMNVGVIVGTYSSIFLAAPIFMYISRRWYSGPPKKRRVFAPAVAAKAEAAEPDAAEPAGDDSEET